MNIDSLGEEKIELLFDKGVISNPADLYNLKKEQLLGLEKNIEAKAGGKGKRISLREKAVENILSGIEASKSIPFERVLYAIGIRYVGETVAKKLAMHFKSMDKLVSASMEELINVPEVGEKIAGSIVEYFSDAKNCLLVNELERSGLKMQVDEKHIPVVMSDILEGKSFVVSGVFSKFTREELKSTIESHGGKVQSGVSAKTNYLVAGDESGPSKLEKAKKLNVTVISESEFELMLNQGEGKH